MRRFSKWWGALAGLTVFAESVGASANASVIWDNVVCMSLPVFVLCLLLPAEDIVTLVGKRFDVRESESSNE